MEKCEERCPFCVEYVAKYDYHNVYLASYGKYKGLPHCGSCGAYLVNGEWIKECTACGKRVDKLCGLFVPHNCKECQAKTVERDRRTGRICSRCRMTYSECCC